MDGTTVMTIDRFLVLLERLVPRVTRSPWDAFPLPPRVHLGFFVHRVKGLEPGLYFLARTEDVLPLAQEKSRPHFSWTKPDKCPKWLLFYQLEAGNVCTLAAGLSCHQSIAGEGVFGASMFAEFEAPLLADGPHIYRRLFWEAGLLGQRLYLETEAVGIQSTGIGCYFDDEMHTLLGLADAEFQSLYHFASGKALEDGRLRSHPAYAHIARAR